MQLSYEEQIKREITKAAKLRNPETELFYRLALGKSATVSFETYKDSYAYPGWLKAHAAELATMEAERRRFSYLYTR